MRHQLFTALKAQTSRLSIRKAPSSNRHFLFSNASDLAGFFPSSQIPIRQTGKLINFPRALLSMSTPMHRDFGDDVLRNIEGAKTG